MAGTLHTKTLLAAAALIALLALAVANTGGTRAVAAGQAGCANAHAEPGEASTAQLRRSMRCLIRNVRNKRDRRPLKGERHLQRLAKDHNKVMLAQDCFDHECRGEASLERRLVTYGYLKTGDRYGFGENTGYAKTPTAMLRSWLRSDIHRKNLLGKRFRHLGLGVGRGSPNPGASDAAWVTYTLVVAWRKR